MLSAFTGRCSLVDTISIRRFEDQDLEPVLDILKRALGESPRLRRTPEWFEWKHFNNPFGRSIILVAEVAGRIAGLRALMRWELTTQAGHLIRCGRPVDTATDPAFARRGIFRALTTEAIEVARAEGLQMLFNTPNPKSGAGYLSMGWQKVGSVGILIRPSLRSWFGRASAEPETELIASGASGVDVDRLDDRAPRGLRTRRQRAYLEWRFTQHPHTGYLQVSSGGGTAILRPNHRSGRAELVISDLFGDEFSRAARLAARSARTAYSASWFSKGSPERLALLRGGFVPVPGMSALTLMARPLVDLDFEFKSMAEWDLALSDLELL